MNLSETRDACEKEVHDQLNMLSASVPHAVVQIVGTHLDQVSEPELVDSRWRLVVELCDRYCLKIQKQLLAVSSLEQNYESIVRAREHIIERVATNRELFPTFLAIIGF